MWSIGRLIDVAAEKASITNRNNTNALQVRLRNDYEYEAVVSGMISLLHFFV